MSHLVSPTAYRIGRVNLWGNLSAQLLESLVWRSWAAYPVGLIVREAYETTRTVYILYYPILSVYRYRRRFLYPRFYRRLGLLSWASSYALTYAEGLMGRLWARASYRFLKRFTIRRLAQNWQDWFRATMMRGSGLSSYEPAIVAYGELRGIPHSRMRSSLAFLESLRSYVRYLLHAQYISPASGAAYCFNAGSSALRLLTSAIYAERLLGPRWLRVLRRESVLAAEQANIKAESSHKGRPRLGAPQKPGGSSYTLSDHLMSEVVSTELRAPTQVKAVNVFKYMLEKGVVLPDSYLEHITSLSSPRTRRDQYLYKTYYDVLNIVFLQSKFLNIEWLILRIVKHALFKMHRLNVKIKYFLRFVHNILKSFKTIGRDVLVFRLVVHGKIKGGTRRTSSYTAGYGRPSFNSIGINTRYCFDNVYSKYGEFGMHLIISRRRIPIS